MLQGARCTAHPNGWQLTAAAFHLMHLSAAIDIPGLLWLLPAAVCGSGSHAATQLPLQSMVTVGPVRSSAMVVCKSAPVQHPPNYGQT